MGDDAKYKVDLHLHTDKSDGLLKPAEMMRAAKSVGLKAISITDHDTVDGLQEAVLAGRREGIEVVPGIELTTSKEGEDIHLIGLFIDYSDANFLAALNNRKAQRVKRALEIVDRLKKLGIDLEMDCAAEFSKREKSIGRPHIAEILLDRGYISTFREAFDKYLGNDCPAYVEVKGLSPAEGIGLIHSAGGLAFLAHPIVYKNQDLIKDILPFCIDGIEVFSPRNTEADVKRYLDVAKRYSLLVSGGSDCHGDAESLSSMGRCAADYEYLVAMKEALLKRREAAA